MSENIPEYDPEVEEVDVQPYEGAPDFDRPQTGSEGRQDD